MAQNVKSFDEKKQDMITSAYTGPDTLSSYDADDFLYGNVPIGDYPEVSAQAIKKSATDSDSQSS